MKGTAFHRLPDNVQFSVIVALFLSVLVLYVPNYDRMIYRQTKPVEYADAYGHAGYPAEDDVPELVSREEVLKERDSYTLVVDAETIEPLHVFYRMSDRTISKSAFLRYFDKNQNKTVAGQFFSVELENGDTMIVLLDDHAVKLPRSGLVRLPIGETKETGEYLMEQLSAKDDFSEEELAHYVDMAGDWRKSGVAGRIELVRYSITFAVFLIVAIGGWVLLVRLDRREEERKEREQRERDEREREYQRKQGGIDG